MAGMSIALPASFVSGTLRVLAVSGELITTSNLSAVKNANLDISTLRAGMYIIDLRSTTGYWQTKFIKAE